MLAGIEVGGGGGGGLVHFLGPLPEAADLGSLTRRLTKLRLQQVAFSHPDGPTSTPMVTDVTPPDIVTAGMLNVESKECILALKPIKMYCFPQP